jgi:hypothetical protein
LCFFKPWHWWYITEIEENELHKEWWGNWATYIWNQWMESYAVNCWLKVLKHFKPTPFILQMTWIVVAQKLRGLEAFGCKWLYTETLFWLSIITKCILCTIVKHPATVCMSLRWVSTERQWFRVWPIQQLMGCIATSIQSESIGCNKSTKGKWHGPRPILETSMTGASTIVCYALWTITGQWNGHDP